MGMFSQSLFEAMPQIVLQTAFIIRSFNDERLRGNGNILLVLLSLVGSVISVANKYRWFDDYNLIKPDCTNWWYSMAAIWRYSHLTARFAACSLVWGVCGGWWLGIYLAVSLIITVCMVSYDRMLDCRTRVDGTCMMLIAVLFYENDNYKRIIFRWMDNIIGILLVAVFASSKFECPICANEEYRQFGRNPVIAGIFIIGCLFWFVDVILFVVLCRNRVFVGHENVNEFEAVDYDEDPESVHHKDTISDEEKAAEEHEIEKINLTTANNAV